MFTERFGLCRFGLRAAALFAVWIAAAPAGAGLAVQQWQTAEGARVYFVENHDLPMLDAAAWFDAGTARDEARMAGLAAITQGLMGLGAGGMSEQRLAERLTDTGARLIGATDTDRAGFTLRTLSSPAERDAAWAILRAVLTTPAFEPAILEREKARATAALAESETRPEFIGERAFRTAVYGTHPYGLSETAASIRALTAEQLRAFHARYYRAANLTLVFMGDLTRAQAEAWAADLSRALGTGEAAAAIPPVPEPGQGGQTVLQHHATQSHLFMGLPGMTRDDPDYFPLLVGNYILGGGGFDSRLMHEIRDARGLAYSAYSYFMPLRQKGLFQLGLQTRREATDEAVGVVRTTLRRFVAEGPTEAEVKQAKASLVNSFPLRLDSSKKIAEQLGIVGFYRLPPDWLETYPQKVETVTREDILRAFRARVRPEWITTVIVGGQTRGGS